MRTQLQRIARVCLLGRAVNRSARRLLSGASALALHRKYYGIVRRASSKADSLPSILLPRIAAVEYRCHKPPLRVPILSLVLSTTKHKLKLYVVESW